MLLVLRPTILYYFQSHVLTESAPASGVSSTNAIPSFLQDSGGSLPISNPSSSSAMDRFPLSDVTTWSGQRVVDFITGVSGPMVAAVFSGQGFDGSALKELVEPDAENPQAIDNFLDKFFPLHGPRLKASKALRHFQTMLKNDGPPATAEIKTEVTEEPAVVESSVEVITID